MKSLPRIAIALLVAVFAVVGTGCYASPENGKVSVVRGDGPIEGHSGIKKIICPGEKTFVYNDETHDYPDSESQRTFKFNNDQDADAPPIENLRTRDGYKVTLQGTVYFKTAFDCTPRGQALLKKFDTANAARPDGQRPWEDFPGYLANQWKPILDSNGRNVMLGFDVKDVLSSAALLSNDPDAAKEVENADNKSTIQAIETALADGLTSQLRQKLGDDFFTDITFNMEQPTLPDVDGAIASAQQAFAKVADVRAEKLRQQELVEVEKQKKLVNEQRQLGYDKCASCATQDEIRALPQGASTYVFGGDTPVAVGGTP